MTRAEHLAWCKESALQYVDAGDPSQAVASMTSDLRKHPELENHAGIGLGAMLMFGGHMKRTDEVRKWIVGFN